MLIVVAEMHILFEKVPYVPYFSMILPFRRL
nr:MAG TPA: hypothetical protein [Caudoviricetes sp.]